MIAPNATGCAALIPNDWRAPVPGADLPAADADVGGWIAFADAQTGRLDQANDRATSSLAIIERCEERDRAALAEAARRKRFLGLF